MDAAGNLYGTTYFGGGNNGVGTVFELVCSSGTSPCSGTYSEQVLYSFSDLSGNGADPYAGLIMDTAGNLYGTTSYGGTSINYGTAFELVCSNATAPCSGTYSEKVLHSFDYTSDGANPTFAGLVIDGSGNLYGPTTNGGANRHGGTAYELVYSAGSYTENVLYSFTSNADGGYPEGGLFLDASGNLYGTTFSYGGGSNNSGTVFELFDTHGTPLPTTTAVNSSANPAYAGDPITLTATVTSTPPGFFPTGSVTFSSQTLSVTEPLVLGTPTLSLSDVEELGGIGTYAVTAQYTPSSNNPAFAASAGAFNQVISESGVVVTTGGNSLTQTIQGSENLTGSINASSFTGSGAGLTNVLAAGLNCSFCIGNAQLGINYAASASQGGPAANSLMFGGLLPSAFQPAGSYASTGANIFTGAQSITGNLSVTGNAATTGTTTLGTNGTAIVKHLSMTFNPSFKPLASGCTTQGFAFAGVNDGDTVAIGVPKERMTAADVMYSAWVSGANTVSIRACAFTTLPKNLGTGAIRVDVWQH